MMERKLELRFVYIGIAILLTAAIFCCFFSDNVDLILKISAGTVAIILFGYKLLTGWLIINLNVDMDAERKQLDDQDDHLSILVKLNKGGTDSLWMKFVEIRVSELVDGNGIFEPKNSKTFSALGTKKASNTLLAPGWTDQPNDQRGSYTISPKESTVFGAYTTIKSGKPYLIEVMILGTRPFYGIESKPGKPIQWRASKVVLP